MYGKWMIGFIASILFTAVAILWLLLRQFDADLGAASFIVGWFTLFGVASLVPIIWLFIDEDKKIKRANKKSAQGTQDGR